MTNPYERYSNSELAAEASVPTIIKLAERLARLPSGD